MYSSSTQKMLHKQTTLNSAVAEGYNTAQAKTRLYPSQKKLIKDLLQQSWKDLHDHNTKLIKASTDKSRPASDAKKSRISKKSEHKEEPQSNTNINKGFRNLDGPPATASLTSRRSILHK